MRGHFLRGSKEVKFKLKGGGKNVKMEAAGRSGGPEHSMKELANVVSTFQCKGRGKKGSLHNTEIRKAQGDLRDSQGLSRGKGENTLKRNDKRGKARFMGTCHGWEKGTRGDSIFLTLGLGASWSPIAKRAPMSHQIA